jgi:hypothetical protein
LLSATRPIARAFGKISARQVLIGVGRRCGCRAAGTSRARLPTNLKAVRYTAEGETVVQAGRIETELAAILKKLDISRLKLILAVG